jgi:hypothetical protein
LVIFALFLSERHLVAGEQSDEPASEISDHIGSVGDTHVKSRRVIAQNRALIGSLLEQFAVHRVQVAVQQLVNLNTKFESIPAAKKAVFLTSDGSTVTTLSVGWPVSIS